MKRTTIFLPDALHRQLREEAFRGGTSMADLIRKRLQNPAAHSRKRPVSRDPLLKVAGICRGPVISSDIDDAIYGR